MTEKLNVYLYDDKSYFKEAIVLDDSDKSPSGVWNIPGRCVLVEPPEKLEGYKIKWNGGTWEYEEEEKEPEPEPPTFEQSKALKLREAGMAFSQKRDAVRFILCNDGNTYGFDCANEDITNFLAAWKAAEISGSTGYKVWLTESTKGLYATVVLLNKQLRNIDAFDRTVFQLGGSAVILLPYCFATVEFSALTLTAFSAAMLVFVGIVHTGVTYLLYFGSLEHVKGQTAAIISYVDPVVAVLASVLILSEPMRPVEVLGAALILGAALFSEIQPRRKELSHD